jgi:hypothetical protein
MRFTARTSAGLALAAALLGGCQTPADAPGPIGSTGSPLPSDVRAIVFIQRVARNDGVGNVFDYTSFQPGARLVKLEPPAANGTLTTLTHDPLFANADIMSWDLSFDESSIVLSARLQGDEHYHLFIMGVDGSNARQITNGPANYVYPIFLAGQRILFTTSKSVEEGSPQFQDEYERQTTAQVGTINLDGSNEVLGARNVSHRVAPALMPDGNVLYTEWRHLGDVNDGQLRLMNPDMTGMREAFGGENKGITNSYLKARYVDTVHHADSGRDTFRIVTIGTSRDRTLQSGKLLLVDLNVAERLAEVTDLTRLVPGDRVPSTDGVGRYYDAEPVGEAKDNQFLVSWADGVVESSLLAMAKTKPNFGVYVFKYDGKDGKRFPIFDDPTMWDVMARPLKARFKEPPITQSPTTTNTGGEKSFVLGALNVNESSLFPELKQTAQAVKVRLMEGFSSEEGFPDMFGLTEFDGQSRLGEVPIYPDGSFSAKLPANVPVHMQLIDKFAMSIANEDVWVSGRGGEQRFCGGCHEDRAKPTLIEPGSTRAVQLGPVNLDVLPRAQRLSADFGYEKVRGVPWNLAIQPILTANCAGCHDGDASKPGNPSYTVIDNTLGTMQTFTFDLRDQPIKLMVGERQDYEFPASYVSLIGLDMEFGENDVMVVGDKKSFIAPGSARSSLLMKTLNPPQQFPADAKVRAFPDMPVHVIEKLGGADKDLTPDQYYQLILNIDMGAQFFFRENKNGGALTTGPQPPYVMP